MANITKKPRIPFFKQETADLICERIACGESLRAILRDVNMPSMSTVLKWLDTMPAFVLQYARAREIQADTMADEIHEIADNPLIGQEKTFKSDGGIETKESDMLQHRRLQIDARKWLMGKMKPKKYGEIKAYEDEETTQNITIHGGLPE